MKLKTLYEYVRELKKYIVVSAGMFFGAALLGFIFAIQSPDQVERFIAMLKESFGPLINLPPYALAMAIFLNNAVKTIAMVLIGVLFGLYPMLSLLGNGYIIGVIAYVAYAKEGWLIFFASILPHGIIELPIIIFAGAIGLRLGILFIQRIFKKNKQSLRYEFKQAVVIAFIVIVPLLFIAACIEAFVTPLIIDIVDRA